MWGGKQIAVLKLEDAKGAAISLTNATMGYITVPFRCRPVMFLCRITTTLSCTSSMTVTCTKTTTGDVGTLIIPTTTADTMTIYDETDYNALSTTCEWLGTLAQGDRLTVVSALTSGSFSAGAGLLWVIVEVDPERPANVTTMVNTA